MNNFRRLTNIFTCFLLFVIPISINAQNKVSAGIYTLPVGTRILVKMDNEINSKVSSVNDTFTVTISSPVLVRDVEMLRAGLVIEGKILNVKPASSGKNGSFDVNFETLQLSNKLRREIDASLVNEIKPPKTSQVFNTLAIIGGTAIGALFGNFANKGNGALIGAGIGAGAGTAAVFLKKGKDVHLKANAVFEIRLNKEVILPAEDF
jgi:hypothetical protein